MRPNVVGRWIGRAGLTCGLALTFAGCPDSPEEITESASAPSFNFPVAPVFDEPANPFAIDRFALADFDTTITDAFSRAVSLLTDSATFFTCGGACPAWEFPIRNGSQDTRLPALQDANAVGLTGITPDSIFGAPFFVRTFAGLNPSTMYTVTLERLALNVNGGVDVVNTLLNNPDIGALQTFPDAPDELVRLGGTPGTTVGSNYYQIETITTDATGAVAFGAPSFTGTGNSDILETNAFATFALPQYNYLVMYEGSPDAGVPVMRAQIGVDLDLTGSPINNAFAPFPTAAFSVPQLVNARGGAGRPDSLSVTFNRLETLVGNAAYEAWLVNPATGSMLPATARYNLIKIIAERDPITGDIVSTRDSLVDSIPATSSFVGGNTEDGFRHQLILSDANLGGGPDDTLGFYTHLVLTVDGSPGDATISSVRPFWTQYTNQGGTPSNFFDDTFTLEGLTEFGRFDLATPAVSDMYTAQGFGLGGVRDDVLSVDLENLSRPPLGYTYVGWLVAEDGTAFRLPDITGPPPERVSLINADAELIPGIVTSTGILDANFRADASELGFDYSNFVNFVIALEPKAGADAVKGSLDFILGALPQRVIQP